LGIFSRKKKIVYFPGCVTQYLNKEQKGNWEAIISDMGLEFETIDKADCCGNPAREAGYMEDFRKIVDKNKKKIGKPDLIISNCPHCVHIFLTYYGYNAKHTSAIMAENTNKILKRKQGKVAFHDPCILSRKIGIVDDPRKVINATGLEIEEFARNKENTVCCGASGGMIHNSVGLSKKIGKSRANQTKCDEIVVCCPHCYHHLKNCTTKKITELSELFME